MYWRNQEGNSKPLMRLVLFILSTMSAVFHFAYLLPVVGSTSAVQLVTLSCCVVSTHVLYVMCFD